MKGYNELNLIEKGFQFVDGELEKQQDFRKAS